jgi:signal peptidase II
LTHRWRWTAGITLAWLILDLWSKSWALRALPGGPARELLGGFLPLTLAFNQGAAFGIRIGDDPRLIFVPLTVVAIVFLLWLVHTARPGDRVRVVAASLVLGGALGNLYDRVRWDRGVVDFFGPVDLGFTLFPIFNVADIGITCGAILLAISFWQEDKELRAEERARSAEAAAGEGGGGSGSGSGGGAGGGSGAGGGGGSGSGPHPSGSSPEAG